MCAAHKEHFCKGYMCVWICVYVGVYVCVGVCVCMYVCMHVCVCMYVYVYVYACMRMYVCMYVCVCMYVYVGVYVCEYSRRQYKVSASYLSVPFTDCTVLYAYALLTVPFYSAGRDAILLLHAIRI